MLDVKRDTGKWWYEGNCDGIRKGQAKKNKSQNGGKNKQKMDGNDVMRDKGGCCPKMR